MSDLTASKQADLAGPGIGNYEDLEKVLPTDYESLLDPKETQIALYAAKDYIEERTKLDPRASSAHCRCPQRRQRLSRSGWFTHAHRVPCLQRLQ